VQDFNFASIEEGPPCWQEISGFSNVPASAITPLIKTSGSQRFFSLLILTEKDTL
jgi:hypothetical protein